MDAPHVHTEQRGALTKASLGGLMFVPLSTITFATLPGIVGVFVTGWLVDRTGSFAAPLFLMAGVALLGAVVYLAFASGERQID
jgi:hypothetical protein